MKKSEAQELISSGKALEALKKVVQPGADENYVIALGRFEAMGNIKEDDTGWTPIGIHKTAGMEMRPDGSFASQGGARIIEQSAKDLGYAFQGSPNSGLAGIWLWGAD